jgi:hypothetical protein
MLFRLIRLEHRLREPTPKAFQAVQAIANEARDVQYDGIPAPDLNCPSRPSSSGIGSSKIRVR